MAAPVASGVAALTLQYVPQLEVSMLKSILTGTVTRYPGMEVFKPGLGIVFFSDLSKYGGITNVYEAVLAAKKITEESSFMVGNAVSFSR
jgi:cell wall-associated protease